MAFIPAALASIGTALGASAATATAVGATVAATTVSVLGVGASALASSNASRFQANLAEMQGKQAQEQAGLKAGEIARENRQKIAAATAGAQENGFDVSGSPLDLINQTERQGQLDYLTAVYDGSVQATGLNATAKNYRNQASNALIGGVLGMGSKALGGMASVYSTKGAAINVSGT